MDGLVINTAVMLRLFLNFLFLWTKDSRFAAKSLFWKHILIALPPAFLSWCNFSWDCTEKEKRKHAFFWCLLPCDSFLLLWPLIPRCFLVSSDQHSPAAWAIKFAAKAGNTREAVFQSEMNLSHVFCSTAVIVKVLWCWTYLNLIYY